MALGIWLYTPDVVDALRAWKDKAMCGDFGLGTQALSYYHTRFDSVDRCTDS